MVVRRQSMGQEIQQRINRSFFDELLTARSLSQKAVAEQLGENEKSFSRWLNQGQIPSRLIWGLRRTLGLKSEEMKILLMVPEFKVFFRRRFLAEPPEETKNTAISWAKTFLDLSSLHSSKKFVPVDYSEQEDPVFVADKIKSLLNIPERVTLDTLISALREEGIEVAFVPFSLLNACGENAKAKEDAFSVTDGKRSCIFVDTNLSRDKAPFVIAHELAHIFRSSKNIDKIEERFCNRIAGEIIYPRSFFDKYSSIIRSIIATNNLDRVISLIEEIKKDIGGEFWGIVLHLKDLGFLKGGGFFGKLNQVGKARSESKNTIHTNFFQEFITSDFAKQKDFWLDPDLQSFPEYVFFNTIKNAIQLDKMTPRAFAEIFAMDLSIADEVASQLRYKFKQELKETIS